MLTLQEATMKFNVSGTYSNNLLASALKQLCERYAEQAANDIKKYRKPSKYFKDVNEADVQMDHMDFKYKGSYDTVRVQVHVCIGMSNCVFFEAVTYCSCKKYKDNDQGLLEYVLSNVYEQLELSRHWDLVRLQTDKEIKALKQRQLNDAKQAI